ncbi:hypothetical protein BN1723_002621, partial [Verticillium longisporum]
AQPRIIPVTTLIEKTKPHDKTPTTTTIIMPAAEVANSDDGSRDDAPSDVVGLEDLGDAVDMATFNQILEMDEPGECEFSQSIVEGFFEQAEETITSMKEEL